MPIHFLEGERFLAVVFFDGPGKGDFEVQAIRFLPIISFLLETF